MADSRLRRLTEERRAALVPRVYCAQTARQAELAGFEAIYATGAGVASSLLAVPDLGLSSFKEVLDQVQYIVEGGKSVAPLSDKLSRARLEPTENRQQAGTRKRRPARNGTKRVSWQPGRRR